MPDPQISIRARADLDAIWSYLSKFNLNAADRFLDQFWSRADTHVRFPKLGVRRDDVVAGLRCFVLGRYVALYRIEGETIRIFRVLHGSRDVPAAFHDIDD